MTVVEMIVVETDAVERTEAGSGVEKIAATVGTEQIAAIVAVTIGIMAIERIVAVKIAAVKIAAVMIEVGTAAGTAVETEAVNAEKVLTGVVTERASQEMHENEVAVEEEVAAAAVVEVAVAKDGAEAHVIVEVGSVGAAAGGGAEAAVVSLVEVEAGEGAQVSEAPLLKLLTSLPLFLLLLLQQLLLLLPLPQNQQHHQPPPLAELSKRNARASGTLLVRWD